MSLATAHHEPIELPNEFWDELLPIAPVTNPTPMKRSPRAMSALVLEVLNGAFMLLRRLSSRKGAKVFPAA